MENEQGDVVSESLLTGNLSSGNIGSKNHVEECFEEEIMVEIVGSDVFVDGVGGHKEGDCGSDLAMDERNSAVVKEEEEEEEVIVSESATVEDGAVSTLPSNGVWNSGIELATVQTEKTVKDIAEKEDSVMANGKECNCGVRENDGIDDVVGEIGLVNDKDGSLDVDCSIEANFVNKVFCAEGEDENRGSLTEIHEKSFVSGKGEHTTVEFDDKMDFEDGELNINLPDSSVAAGNDEFLETDEAHDQNQEKCLNAEIQADTEEKSQPNTLTSNEIIVDQKNGEKLPILEASIGDMPLSAKDECSKAEIADVMLIRHDIDFDNPVADSEVCFNNIIAELSSTQTNEKEEHHESSNCDDVSWLESSNMMENVVIYEINGFDIEEDHNLETMKPVGPMRINGSDYLLSLPENEGHFSPSDLVWGKVRSHPWWPGQIFDPSEASEKAVKYCKKDSYLVAYFGDRTFAWNDASVLKPFRSYFPQIEKQSNSEAFQNAVDSALEEVSRRVELGLACSCIPKDEYSRIEVQVVENAAIREESRVRYGVDNSCKASNFQPEKLVEYIKELGPLASRGPHMLDVVIAKAQLSAFYRFKGSRLPCEFPSCGELLENDERIIRNDKRAPEDGSLSRKERSLNELMEYSPDAEGHSVSLSSGRKQKAVGSPSIPKRSFKIGECIKRVASQLTGSKGEMVINSSLKTEEHSGVVFSAESLFVDEMLSHLQLIALDPKKRCDNFQDIIHPFFLGFRSSITLKKRGRKKKAEKTIGEEFEFDDVNDSYWTDRIVQNGENGNGNLVVVPFDPERLRKPGQKPNSRKRFLTSELDESVKRRKKQESSPAELILNFAERKCVPSEINLNKMFRRFGPLMESETEVDHETGRAKVIFKRGSDAEVALNSSENFNIFGPVLVNYEIGYTPLISVKILPVAIPHRQEDDILMI